MKSVKLFCLIIKITCLFAASFEPAKAQFGLPEVKVPGVRIPEVNISNPFPNGVSVDLSSPLQFSIPFVPQNLNPNGVIDDTFRMFNPPPEFRLPSLDQAVDWVNLQTRDVDWPNMDLSKINWKEADPGKIDWTQVDLSKVDWKELDLKNFDLAELARRNGYDLQGVDLAKLKEKIESLDKLADVDLNEIVQKAIDDAEKEVSSIDVQKMFVDAALDQARKWADSPQGLEIRELIVRNHIWYGQVVEGLKILKANKILTKESDCVFIGNLIAEGVAKGAESEGASPLEQEALETFTRDFASHACADTMREKPAPGVPYGGTAASILRTTPGYAWDYPGTREILRIDPNLDVWIIRPGNPTQPHNIIHGGRLTDDPRGNAAYVLQANWRPDRPLLHFDRFGNAFARDPLGVWRMCYLHLPNPSKAMLTSARRLQGGLKITPGFYWLTQGTNEILRVDPSGDVYFLNIFGVCHVGSLGRGPDAQFPHQIQAVWNQYRPTVYFDRGDLAAYYDLAGILQILFRRLPQTGE